MLAEILGADGIIVIIVVVAVLLFGGTKIPKLARGLGSASHEFKKGLEEGDKEGGHTATAVIVPPVQIAPPVQMPQSVQIPEAVPKDSSGS